MMPRALFLTMLLLLACGCGRDLPSPRGAGPAGAHAAVVEGGQHGDATVARRVLAGVGADMLASPSPDGSFLAYTEWRTGDLAILDLATASSRLLTANPEPYRPGYAMHAAVDGTGEEIAYTWLPEDRPAEAELRVVGVEGGVSRRVYGGEGVVWVRAEGWSADGQWILAWDVREEDNASRILLVSTEGAVRVVKALGWRGPAEMSLSPDGRYIVYDHPQADTTSRRDIYLLDLEGGRLEALVEDPADDALLGWSPDGRHVLFSSDRGGTPGAWLLPVRAGRAAGEPVLVKPDFWRASPIGFSADGRFFYTVETGTQDLHMAPLDAVTGRVRGEAMPLGSAPATGRFFGSVWSPDGHRLAYRVHQPPFGLLGRNAVVVRSVASGQRREIPLPPGLYPLSVRWSPDGRSLLVMLLDRSGRAALNRLDLQTGRPEVVLRLPPEEYPYEFAVLPDRSRIIYRAFGRDQNGPRGMLVLRSLGNGEGRVLYDDDRPLGGSAVSPAGDAVAVVLERSAGEEPGEEPGETMDLVLLPVDGGEPRRLAAVPAGASPAWSADGAWILFTRPDPADPSAPVELWRVASTGGAPEAAGLALPNLRHPRVSPDGRTVAFSAGTTAGEVWVLEQFLPEVER